MACGIYKITSPSNNCYVGQAIDFEQRWAKHKRDLKGGRGVNRILQNAFNKYGIDNFEFSVLEELEILDPQELKAQLLIREQYWVSLLKPKYNVRHNCVVSNLGVTFGPLSEEHRKKIGDAHRGEKNANFGKPLSEERKLMLRKANLGRPISESHRKRLIEANSGPNHPNWGISLSKETKKKISNSLKGQSQSEETKRKRVDKLRKFTDNQEAEMLALFQSGSSQREIAAKFGVHHPTVGSCIRRAKARSGL